MHFIDDIYFVGAYLWWDANLIDQISDVIDRVVGSSIQLVNIERIGPVKRNT
jgi:hypothetical protein